jgi:uncharacterized protein (DUF1810 family)
LSLSRFTAAQGDPDDGYETALRELRAGRKRSHWIWYVFPQISGLGASPTAREYALADPAEAEAYLEHPVLGERLVRATEVVLGHLAAVPPAALVTLMGARIDALKLVSCMTLFEGVARHLATRAPGAASARMATIAPFVLAAASAQGFPRCAHTEARLRAAYPSG